MRSAYARIPQHRRPDRWRRRRRSWLNARLRRLGFATLLVDKGALGGGQSVKSRGIHGGTKYALSGVLPVPS